MKSKTKDMKIQEISDAPILYIPLLKSYGSIPEPLVKIGERVLKYQLIGRSTNHVTANVHSPVSGVVTEIKETIQINGSIAVTIVINNDFTEEEIDLPTMEIDHNNTANLLQIIENAGIVGEGGAKFPTALKYKLDGYKINTFIVNGTECEPYLTADYALMAERTKQLLSGINIVNSILQAKDVVITIEKQNKELLKVFGPYLEKNEYKHIRIVMLPNEYPQGSELQLIKSITGIEMPKSTLPREIGVIVSNVGTICSIHEAVIHQHPVISRIVTLSGEELENMGNYEVKIGTPISHIIGLSGISANDKTIVIGGPMMGQEIKNRDTPIDKGSSGVLFFKKQEILRDNCISCGYCVDECPMNLLPMKFEENYRKGRYLNLEKYSISSCVECGACEYICPSNVPLIESIKEGKIKLKELTNAIN